MTQHKKLDWNSINWPLVTTRVKRIQCRIFKHSQAGNKHRVHWLQNILVNSLDSKLLAVRKVTTDNSGKKTAGVDKQVALTPEAKVRLVTKLSLDGKAAPIRRVWIPKPGKAEKRSLGIPTSNDRAKQALAHLALEPEWEAKFDPNSYGFRPGRSCHDAIEAIYGTVRNTGKPGYSPKYVLDADLRKCFDLIDHDYVINKLDTFKVMEKQIHAWLKDGIVEEFISREKYPGVGNNNLGTPQGGIISPLLANIALDGIEKHLKEWISSYPVPGITRMAAKIESLSVIRYADDFVVLHRNRDVLMDAKAEIETWLSSTSKLAFNEEKTSIVSVASGFQFLGSQIICVKREGYYRAKIYPTKDAQKSIVKKVGDICRKNRAASSYQLIEMLSPVILGWGNYYKYAECKDVFKKIDHRFYLILRSWFVRRARKKGRTETKEALFPSGNTYTFDGRKYQDNWVLVGQKKSPSGHTLRNHLPRISWISSSKFIKVKGMASPYDGNHIYWGKRLSSYYALNNRQKTLLKRQVGK